MSQSHTALPKTLGILLTSVIFLWPHFALAADGGYPWAGATKVSRPPAQDNITWGFNSQTQCNLHSLPYTCSNATLGFFSSWYFRDQWGYDLRNCTSYVAWRVNKEFGSNIAGWGNATTWALAAERAGLAVSDQPEPGDIAQWDSGHVGFVEAVIQKDGKPWARVAEYNQQLDGAFRDDRLVQADHYIDINGLGQVWQAATHPAPEVKKAAIRLEAMPTTADNSLQQLLTTAAKTAPAPAEEANKVVDPVKNDQPKPAPQKNEAEAEPAAAQTATPTPSTPTSPQPPVVSTTVATPKPAPVTAPTSAPASAAPVPVAAPASPATPTPAPMVATAAITKIPAAQRSSVNAQYATIIFIAALVMCSMRLGHRQKK